MRKKLALLLLALSAVAASAHATSPTTSSICPPDTRPIVCPTHILCCPLTAICACG